MVCTAKTATPRRPRGHCQPPVINRDGPRMMAKKIVEFTTAAAIARIDIGPTSLAQNGSKTHHNGLRIADFHDQLLVPLMIQRHDDRVGRIVHVPEHQLAVIIKRSSGKKSRHVRPKQLPAMPPAADL